MLSCDWSSDVCSSDLKESTSAEQWRAPTRRRTGSRRTAHARFSHAPLRAAARLYYAVPGHCPPHCTDDLLRTVPALFPTLLRRSQSTTPARSPTLRQRYSLRYAGGKQSTMPTLPCRLCRPYPTCFAGALNKPIYGVLLVVISTIIDIDL